MTVGSVRSAQEGTSKIQMAGDTLWNTTASGLIQRIDPRTGAATGEAWQLPAEDLHRDPKGQADWRLLSAGGSLWLLGGDRIVRYDIPTSPVVPPVSAVVTAVRDGVGAEGVNVCHGLATSLGMGEREVILGRWLPQPGSVYLLTDGPSIGAVRGLYALLLGENDRYCI